MKINTFVTIFFTLLFISTFGTEDWKSQVVMYYLEASTSNDPTSYIWYEEPDIGQGIHIGLAPTEVVNIYVEKENAVIVFGHYTGINIGNWSHTIVELDVNVNDQGYNNLYQGSPQVNVLWDCSSTFNTIGDYNLKVRYIVAGSTIQSYREYNIKVVPQSDKLFSDQYGNTMRLWKGNANSPYPLILSPGFDAYNTKPEQYYRDAGEELFDCLLENGFDIYVLYYKYNPQDLRNNAAVYSSAINYISNTWNNSENIAASGISMGGVISRYALAKAEHDNNPLPVDKWLSIDSPQQGAYISKELQDFLKDETSDPFDQFASNNEAAKIMLMYNAYDQHPNGFNTTTGDNKGPIHTTFYNELNSLNGDGYPHLTYNIGVSFSTDDPSPYSGVWLNIQVGIILNKDFNLEPLEKISGSYLPELNVDPSTVLPFWGLLWPTLTVTQSQDPVFISNESSLAISNGVSKFDKPIIPSITGFHDHIPTELIPQIVNELVKDELYLQNQIITENKHFKANETIFSGRNVTNHLTPGDFVIEPGANVLFQSGSNIILKPGFLSKSNSSLRAYIDPYFTCSNQSSDKTRQIKDNISSSQNSEISIDAKEEYTLNINNQNNFNVNCDVKIYPNPSTNLFNVELFAPLLDADYQIINSFGTFFQSGKLLFNNSKQVINLTDYPNGIYFIKISLPDDVIVRKLIKY